MIFVVLFLLVCVSEFSSYVWPVSVSYSVLLSQPCACCVCRSSVSLCSCSCFLCLVSWSRFYLQYLSSCSPKNFTGLFVMFKVFLFEGPCSFYSWFREFSWLGQLLVARGLLDTFSLVGLYLLRAGCWNYLWWSFFAACGFFGLLLSILILVFIYLVCYICKLASPPPILGFSILLISTWSIFCSFFQLFKNVELFDVHLQPR